VVQPMWQFRVPACRRISEAYDQGGADPVSLPGRRDARASDGPRSRAGHGREHGASAGAGQQHGPGDVPRPVPRDQDVPSGRENQRVQLGKAAGSNASRLVISAPRVIVMPLLAARSHAPGGGRVTRQVRHKVKGAMAVPLATRGEETDRGGQIPRHPGQMQEPPPLAAVTSAAPPARTWSRAAASKPVPIPRRYQEGSTRTSGILLAMSTAENPTGSVPAPAIRPSPSSAMPGWQQRPGRRHCRLPEPSTHSRSAAAANGRIRHHTPAIIPPASH
jgi:hypothetical protein